MKIDLLKMSENSKKDKKEIAIEIEEREFKDELYDTIAAICKGDDCFKTNKTQFETKLGIKLKDNFDGLMFLGPSPKKYSFKLNKKNIQKIQKYIDKTLNKNER